MTSHEHRLQILAQALALKDADEVIDALRSKNVLYLGPGGQVLLSTAREWSDEQLAEAAVDLFINHDLSNDG